MPLQHEFRPNTLDEVYGNEAAVEAIRSVLNRDESDIPHSFLFTGPSGCGKTTLARIVANELGIKTDFTEIDASSDRGIDNIRKLKENSQYAALDGGRKGILLDEFHGVTPQAQEATLKLLEDTPKHVFLFLATTEENKIKKTVKRRCHHIEVNELTRSKILELLDDILNAKLGEEEAEKFPRKVLSDIAKKCWGSPGQAVKLLDTVYKMDNEDKMIEALSRISFDEEDVRKLCRILISEKSIENKWGECRDLLKRMNGDAESMRYQILGYLKTVLLNDSSKSILTAQIMTCFMDSVMYTGIPGLCVCTYWACQEEG